MDDSNGPLQLFPTLYPANDGASTAADTGDCILCGSGYLAKGRTGGAGDARQALLRLGDGVLCSLLGCRSALGGCLGGAGGGGSGATLGEKARLPEDQPGQD